MIKVEQMVGVYEHNGKAIPVGKSEEIGISSHWNRDSMVVIEVGDETFTVNADDLLAAIKNATNTNR